MRVRAACVSQARQSRSWCLTSCSRAKCWRCARALRSSPLLQRPTLRLRPSWEGHPVRTRTRALPCGCRPSARRDYTYYAHCTYCAYCSQVTAPPKRKARPSDIARQQKGIQAREEDRRQRQLPSRGWADVDEPAGG